MEKKAVEEKKPAVEEKKIDIDAEKELVEYETGCLHTGITTGNREEVTKESDSRYVIKYKNGNSVILEKAGEKWNAVFKISTKK